MAFAEDYSGDYYDYKYKGGASGPVIINNTEYAMAEGNARQRVFRPGGTYYIGADGKGTLYIYQGKGKIHLLIALEIFFVRTTMTIVRDHSMTAKRINKLKIGKDLPNLLRPL